MSLPRKASDRRPATTSKGREDQLISLAVDLAEKQLIAGSASSQVITHFLKLGCTREQLEQERLHRENLLLEAKANQIASEQRVEQLMQEALSAMKQYSGQVSEDDFGEEGEEFDQ